MWVDPSGMVAVIPGAQWTPPSFFRNSTRRVGSGGTVADLPSFILYDPNTHFFSVNSHITHMSTTLQGLFGGPVHRISTVGWTAGHFTDWWNSLTGDIGAVVFFGHTVWDRIQFDSNNDGGRNSASDLGININQLQNLNTIALNMMIIMGCFSGDMSRDNNMSTEFARLLNRGGTVFGSDGFGRDRPRIMGAGGTSRIVDGSQYFIGHVYRGGDVHRYQAVNAASWARPGTHIRQMHEWSTVYHWILSPNRHLFQ